MTKLLHTECRLFGNLSMSLNYGSKGLSDNLTYNPSISLKDNLENWAKLIEAEVEQVTLPDNWDKGIDWDTRMKEVANREAR